MNSPSTQTVTIAGRSIGRGHPPYIVAEMSANHLGDFDRAVKIVEAAREAGADAVKVQTYTADTITIDHDGPGFALEGGLWKGRRLHELYVEAHMPWSWHEALFERGRQVGIPVFSSPFDPTAVDLLESLDAPAYKIASFEIVDLPLIARVAATGRPVIVSTGMANLTEIAEAVSTARGAGCESLILLHCVSGYPTPASEFNLRTIPHLAEAFGTPVGLSDHSLGIGAAVAAVSLGAVMVEKHFTLSRDDGGPDAAFSLEPAELAQLVESTRTASAALGDVSYVPAASESGYRELRRSLYVVADVAKGETFTHQTVRSIRPGFGLAPKFLGEVIGRRARRSVRRGEPLAWTMVDLDEVEGSGSR